MSAPRKIDLPGFSATVKELTVAEVRAWLVDQESGAPVDALRAMVFDDCSLDDLARLSDAPVDLLEGLKYGELVPLRDACKALNPHFFRVRAALVRVARQIQAEVESLSSTARSA